MPKYRKKTVVIEAIQLKADALNLIECYEFLGVSNKGDFEKTGYGIDVADGQFKIKTLFGSMIVNIGDWIIKSVKGEFYLCKPDIFESTYELVEE